MHLVVYGGVMLDSRNGRVSRRSFLHGAAVGSAALWSSSQMVSAASAARVLGSNDTIRVGVIGLNGRGGGLVNEFRRVHGVQITALCDVDSAVLSRRMAEAEKAGDKPQGFTDARALFDADCVDAVVIATPNHWHTLLGVWACERGVDAYVEKPVSHDVWEGAQLEAAARRHGRVVACGTQSRSNPGMQELMAFVQGGELGAVKLARGLCYKPRGSIGKVDAPKQPPKTVDYDLWLGPAEQQPVRRRRFHYDWHWQWPFGNGDLGNQGVHQMDMCRWGVGADGLPPQAWSLGGRVGYDDDGDTPNTQILWLGYEPAPIIFEVRGLPRERGKGGMDKFLGADIGVVFHCDHGYVVSNHYAGGYACDPSGKRIREFKGGGSHAKNFIDAARAGDSSLLSADAREGHLSAALCHLGNDSVRHGAEMPAVEVANQALWLPEMSEAWGRVQGHLERNELPLVSTPVSVGKLLQEKEIETCSPRAYRNPFVVEPQI